MNDVKYSSSSSSSQYPSSCLWYVNIGFHIEMRKMPLSSLMCETQYICKISQTLVLIINQLCLSLTQKALKFFPHFEIQYDIHCNYTALNMNHKLIVIIITMADLFSALQYLKCPFHLQQRVGVILVTETNPFINQIFSFYLCYRLFSFFRICTTEFSYLRQVERENQRIKPTKCSQHPLLLGTTWAAEHLAGLCLM